jgi:hypothetical protein
MRNIDIPLASVYAVQHGLGSGWVGDLGLGGPAVRSLASAGLFLFPGPGGDTAEFTATLGTIRVRAAHARPDVEAGLSPRVCARPVWGTLQENSARFPGPFEPRPIKLWGGKPCSSTITP